MLKEEMLDSLSRELARRLLQRYPEWHRFVEIEGPDDGQESTVLLKVPQPETDQFLWIDTADGEISIGFANWHTHAGLWLEDGDEESESSAVECALRLITQIIDELVVVVVTTRNGEWTGSTLLAAEEDISSELGETVTVCSWRRTYDRVFDA